MLFPNFDAKIQKIYHFHRHNFSKIFPTNTFYLIIELFLAKLTFFVLFYHFSEYLFAYFRYFHYLCTVLSAVKRM